jgi:hypothetical protein
VVKGSLDNGTTSLVDPWISLRLGSIAYGVVVIVPLLLSALGRLRWFGAAILAAFLVSN